MKREMMIDFKLYGITDRKQCASPSLVEHLEKACASGLRAIQLREKDLEAGAVFELALQVRDATVDYGILLFINDRVDVAMAAGADGVHCTESSIPPDEVKALDKNLLVGASVHSIEAAREAESSGADFLLFGPVFFTDSKDYEVIGEGVERLASVCDSVTVPVYAVGGINTGNCRDCIEHKATGIATISSLMNTTDVESRLNEYESELTTL